MPLLPGPDEGGGVVRLAMLFAAIVAALFTAPAGPVSAADRFYLHDSVPFGQWNDGWWDDDACPPPGAERLLCDFPNSACGGTSVPAVCYAFVQFGDTCHAVSYPAGDWTFDLYISAPVAGTISGAIVTAACDTLCGGIVEIASGSAAYPAGNCERVQFTADAAAFDVDAEHRVGLRISHDAAPSSVRLCWGATCQSRLSAPGGTGCPTAVRATTWGGMKAHYP